MVLVITAGFVVLGRDQRDHVLQRHGSAPTSQLPGVMRAVHDPPRRVLYLAGQLQLPRPVDL
ncbi:hypothetical protein ACWDKQ_35485, partial [Saccharopolyspora sp. NPDC000995]